MHPLGHAINPNIAMVTSFSCHEDEAEARARGLDGFRFFQFALAYHYALASTSQDAATSGSAIWPCVMRSASRRPARYWYTPTTARTPARLCRSRSGSGHFHSAGREESACAHLRVARTLCFSGCQNSKSTRRSANARRWRHWHPIWTRRCSGSSTCSL